MNWNRVELYACVSMSDDIWRVPLWERLSGAYTLEHKTLFEAHHSSCDHKCTDIVTCCKIGRFHSIVCCDAGKQYDALLCGVVYKGDESFIWLFNWINWSLSEIVLHGPPDIHSECRNWFTKNCSSIQKDSLSHSLRWIDEIFHNNDSEYHLNWSLRRCVRAYLCTMESNHNFDWWIAIKLCSIPFIPNGITEFTHRLTVHSTFALVGMCNAISQKDTMCHQYRVSNEQRTAQHQNSPTYWVINRGCHSIFIAFLIFKYRTWRNVRT